MRDCGDEKVGGSRAIEDQQKDLSACSLSGADHTILIKIMALKSVLITGCSAGGIGSALVEEFQKRNMRVFATAREVSKMSHLEKLPNVTLLNLEPTSLQSVQTAVKEVEAQTSGTLDYLVNNAGQTIIMPTLDFDIDTAKNMYDINIWGMMRVTQEFISLVIAARGTIINISSIAPFVNTPWMGERLGLLVYVCFALANNTQGVYTGSKAAMTAISDTLRLELAPFDVRVVTVNTGAVSTNGLATGKAFKLPPTSRYKSIEETIAARARGEDGTPRMEPNTYAEKVVTDVLGGANWQIWRGGYASIVKVTSAWLPASISVSYTSQNSDEARG